MSRIFFLLLYAIYALTPIHMYAMSGGGNGGPGRLHVGKHASTDIVWANVLFSSLVDDDEASSAGARVSAGSQQGGDVVLVKKRRALFREQFDFTPLLDIEMLPPGGLERTPFRSADYETTKDPLLRETDGCLVLNTGLSPPSQLLS
ncbi:MAG: hypothetical protein ACM3MD_03935 [Betaproteobacteria bacterium]